MDRQCTNIYVLIFVRPHASRLILTTCISSLFSLLPFSQNYYIFEITLEMFFKNKVRNIFLNMFMKRVFFLLLAKLFVFVHDVIIKWKIVESASTFWSAIRSLFNFWHRELLREESFFKNMFIYTWTLCYSDYNWRVLKNTTLMNILPNKCSEM